MRMHLREKHLTATVNRVDCMRSGFLDACIVTVRLRPLPFCQEWLSGVAQSPSGRTWAVNALT